MQSRSAPEKSDRPPPGVLPAKNNKRFGVFERIQRTIQICVVIWKCTEYAHEGAALAQSARGRFARTARTAGDAGGHALTWAYARTAHTHAHRHTHKHTGTHTHTHTHTYRHAHAPRPYTREQSACTHASTFTSAAAAHGALQHAHGAEAVTAWTG